MVLADKDVVGFAARSVAGLGEMSTEPAPGKGEGDRQRKEDHDGCGNCVYGAG